MLEDASGGLAFLELLWHRFQFPANADVQRFPIDISIGVEDERQRPPRPDVFLRVSNRPEESAGTRNGFMRLHVASSSRWDFIRYARSLTFELYIDAEGSEWNTQWRQLAAANVTKGIRRNERWKRGTWRVPMARFTRREREGRDHGDSYTLSREITSFPPVSQVKVSFLL